MLRNFIRKNFCHVDISPLCMPLVANQVFILDFQWKAFKEFLPISMGKLKTLFSRCSVFLKFEQYFLNSLIIQEAKTNKILFRGGRLSDQILVGFYSNCISSDNSKACLPPPPFPQEKFGGRRPSPRYFLGRASPCCVLRFSFRWLPFL